MTARADLLLSASQVAAVTGASARLQGQRYAHHIYTHSAGDSIPCGHGDDRYVTAETVYRIAITEACAKAGVHIRNAAKSALLFAEDQRGRHANTLYEFGRDSTRYRGRHRRDRRRAVRRVADGRARTARSSSISGRSFGPWTRNSFQSKEKSKCHSIAVQQASTPVHPSNSRART